MIAQKAFNTQNHISTEVGELETCMTLAANAMDSGMQEMEDWKEMAIANVNSLCMPCSKYSNTLLEFVLKFGGGGGAPLIAFMDAVADGFGCNEHGTDLLGGADHRDVRDENVHVSTHTGILGFSQFDLRQVGRRCGPFAKQSKCF